MDMLDLAASFALFCLIMTASPGPNNMMMLVSGARVGTLRSMPLALGVACGMASLLLAVGAGLGASFRAAPVLQDAMRLVSAVFLVWLAYKIATAGPLKSAGNGLPILGFRTGLAFQWINPKSWAVTMSATATYLPAERTGSAIVLGAAILAAIALASVVAWIVFGGALGRLLQNPLRARVFNLAMAALLLASTLPILFGRLT